MSKKKKITLISVFVAVVAVAAIVTESEKYHSRSEEFQGTDCIRERWL